MRPEGGDSRRQPPPEKPLRGARDAIAQIKKVFSERGLLRLDPLGAEFDPYEPEALFPTPVEGQEPGTVALVNKGLPAARAHPEAALVLVVKEA